ncbi:MAG: DUF922 domain-containing protein [Caulobacteraceae bacterium]|nr:DUF922 domain-containing protein [Caulobacteraceae bacterium]
MILSLTAVAVAAALAGQTPEADPAPASARLVEAARGAGLADRPDLALQGYEVEGRSPRSLRDSIDRRRPRSQASGERHDARTQWSYRTRWRNGPDGQCIPATATVILTLTMVLPDLASREGLSSREQADWDRYFAALVAHEGNHVRIAVAGQEQMQTAMRASATCEAMTAVVGATNAEVRAASETYDSQTDHGRREGAVYPRPGV